MFNFYKCKKCNNFYNPNLKECPHCHHKTSTLFFEKLTVILLSLAFVTFIILFMISIPLVPTLTIVSGVILVALLSCLILLFKDLNKKLKLRENIKDADALLKSQKNKHFRKLYRSEIYLINSKYSLETYYMYCYITLIREIRIADDIIEDFFNQQIGANVDYKKLFNKISKSISNIFRIREHETEQISILILQLAKNEINYLSNFQRLLLELDIKKDGYCPGFDSNSYLRKVDDLNILLSKRNEEYEILEEYCDKIGVNSNLNIQKFINLNNSDFEDYFDLIIKYFACESYFYDMTEKVEGNENNVRLITEGIVSLTKMISILDGMKFPYNYPAYKEITQYISYFKNIVTQYVDFLNVISNKRRMPLLLNIEIEHLSDKLEVVVREMKEFYDGNSELVDSINIILLLLEDKEAENPRRNNSSSKYYFK